MGHSLPFHKFNDYRVVISTTTVPFLEDDVPAGKPALSLSGSRLVQKKSALGTVKQCSLAPPAAD